MRTHALAPRAKRRPGGGHAHERQADHVAARFLRGEKRLARFITPAPAAGFTLPSSPAVPLASGLRAELEQAFGADLGAVRLHNDASAYAAAREFGAYAFASGTHVYFGRGQFRPATDDGKELLAHELAHVLQQTGRAAFGGGLSATPARSGGEIQRAVPDYPTLRALHEPKKKKKADEPVLAKYEAVAALIEERLARPDAGPALDALVAERLAEIRDWPAEAESLLYDTLKLKERYDAAAQLIERDDFAGGIRIRTALWSGRVLPELKKRNKGEAVLVKAVEAHPALQKYTDEYVRTIGTTMLQSLDDPVPELKRQPGKAAAPTIAEEAATLYKELDDPAILSANEWYYSALAVLVALDSLRMRRLAAIRKAAIEAASKAGEPRLLAKRRIAEGVEAWGDEFLASTKGAEGVLKSLEHELDPAWDAFLRALGRRVQKAAKEALAVWQHRDALDEARTAFFEPGEKDPAARAEERAQAQRTLARVKAAGEAVGMPEFIVGALDELNEHSTLKGAARDTRPGPEEFRDRAAKLVETWGAFRSDKLEQPQVAQFHQRKTDEVAAYLWLSLWVEARRANLAWMAGGGAGTPNVASVAQMHIQRLRFAGSMSRFAQLLQWGSVRSAAKRILTAVLEPEDVLAIVPDEHGRYWNEQPVKTEAVVEVGRIEGWEPITGEALALLYQADYYRALANAITGLRPQSTAEERRIVQAKSAVPFIIASAEKTLTALPRPRKWAVAAARWEYARRPTRTKTDAQLVQEHPSWAGELAREQPAGFIAIFPVDLLQQTLRVWFVPAPWHILPKLKSIDVLSARVAAGLPGKGTPAEKLAAAKALDDATWWEALRKALQPDPKKALSHEEASELAAVVAAVMRRERLTAQEEARAEMIRAMRTDRQLMADIIRADLAVFKGDRYRLDASNRVLSNLRKYAIATSRLWQYGLKGEFVSDTDAKASLTTLMLDIAPELLDVFGSEDRFDIVHGVLGFLEEASAFLPTFEAWNLKTRGRFLPPEQNNAVWIKLRKDALEEITKNMRAVRAQVQQRRGFKAYAKDSTVKVFMAYSKPLEPDMLIVPRPGGLLADPSNEHYRIVKVLKDFTFHPAYGFGGAEAALAGKRKPSHLRTGYAKAQFLEHDDKTPVGPGKLLEIAVLKWDPKRKVHVSVRARQLGPEDAGWDDLYDGLTWAAFGSAMETAQEIIEWQINLYLDVLEMIPGWGKIITAGKVAYHVANFLASGTYDDMIRILSGGLKETAVALYDRLKESADPTVLIELLLFGDPRLDQLLAHSRLGAEPGAAKTETPNKSRLRKIVAAFKRLGRAVFRALRKLNERVHTPMGNVRTFVATRPALAFAFGFAAANIYTLAKAGRAFAGLAQDAEGKQQGKALAELESRARGEQAGFADKMKGILAQIEALQLPAQVLDVRPAYQAVIDELLMVAAKAIGTEARFVAMVLERTGLIDLLTEQIASAMVARGLDPNIYWREQVVPAIGEKFSSARDALVVELNNVLQSPAFSGIFGRIPSPPPATVTTDGPEFEETRESYVEPPPAEAAGAPFRSLDRPLRLRPATLPAAGPGSPLDTRIRRPLERAFGADLRHVRLHTGGDGGAMTDAFGVDGLATGSHIFLRGGLAPESGRGARVMRHEVAHVVQQTGPRFGAPASPVAGNPDAGLAYDPARERRADALAKEADARLGAAGVAPAAAAAPLGVPPGLEPFELDPYTVAKLLKNMSSLSAVLKAGDILERAKTPQKLPGSAGKTAAAALKAVKTLASHPGLKHAKVFKDALPLIENRFNGKRQKDDVQEAHLTDTSFQEIAKEALSTLPTASGTGGGTGAGLQVIKPDEFCRKLESYVVARTGVVLGLKAREVAAPVDATVKHTVSETDPFEEISVLFIYLPEIDGRSPLWSEVMDNTWPTQTKEFKQKARGIVRDVLTMKKVNLAVFAAFGDKFKFGVMLRKEVEDLVNKPKAGALEAKDLPDWKTYAKTGESEPEKVGVRLSTYGHPSQTAPGRESHHLTQFLVADYFANANPNAQPFKTGRKYPGVKWKGVLVDAIAPDAAGTGGISVVKTFGSSSNRGRDMPAMSLAAPTHRKGDLHITPEADDFDNTDPKKTQSTAVDNRFRGYIPAALRADAAATAHNDYLKTHDDSDVAETIYSAAQKTYRWVEKEMSDKLKATMPQLEMQYFLGLAQFKPEVDINHDDGEKKKFLAQLQEAAGHAKTHNDVVMKSLGWTLG